jgi:hydroxymethylpyrimidine/phosphomethylpyrimidine kinase
VTIPRVLSIAGSDSGGGAGIQADIKTITMLGGHAMTAITAITAQNTRGVIEIMPVPTDMVLAQIDAVASDIGIDAVKIGMIRSVETVKAVASRLMPARLEKERRGRAFDVVFDPVMIATSGTALADEAAIEAFDQLLAVATVVTPNAPELAALTGLQVGTEAQLEAAAKALAERYGLAVLAKGGHLPGEALIDLLALPDGTIRRWTGKRIETRHSHGTGCTLSSAIAVGLGAGLSLEAAITRARDFVRSALEAAPGLGEGHGPMGHGLGRAHFIF